LISFTDSPLCWFDFRFLVNESAWSTLKSSKSHIRSTLLIQIAELRCHTMCKYEQCGAFRVHSWEQFASVSLKDRGITRAFCELHAASCQVTNSGLNYPWILSRLVGNEANPLVILGLQSRAKTFRRNWTASSRRFILWTTNNSFSLLAIKTRQMHGRYLCLWFFEIVTQG
jgi:hypothetical protein